jgi:hypothetical protein
MFRRNVRGLATAEAFVCFESMVEPKESCILHHGRAVILKSCPALYFIEYSAWEDFNRSWYFILRRQKVSLWRHNGLISTIVHKKIRPLQNTVSGTLIFLNTFGTLTSSQYHRYILIRHSTTGTLRLITVPSVLSLRHSTTGTFSSPTVPPVHQATFQHLRY